MDAIIKWIMAAAGTILTYWSGQLSPLILVLSLAMVLDYITGIYKAILIGNGLSSKVALLGFFKKLLYFALIAAAFCFDYLIFESTGVLGIEIAYPAIFGTLAICYLLSGELISILENLEHAGIKVPFLTEALRSFREKVEKKEDST